jgi:S4 domain protein YaaA
MSKQTAQTELTIHTPYIQLGQLLKMVGLVESGGEVKQFLQRHTIQVNDQVEVRRGRKLYPGDQVVLPEQRVIIRHL